MNNKLKKLGVRIPRCKDCYHFYNDDEYPRGFCYQYGEFCRKNSDICDHFGEDDGFARYISYVDHEVGELGYETNTPYIFENEDADIRDVVKVILKNKYDGYREIEECVNDLKEEYDDTCWQIKET